MNEKHYMHLDWHIPGDYGVHHTLIEISKEETELYNTLQLKKLCIERLENHVGFKVDVIDFRFYFYEDLLLR